MESERQEANFANFNYPLSETQLEELERRIMGLHSAKEALSERESNILAIAEALLRDVRYYRALEAGTD